MSARDEIERGMNSYEAEIEDLENKLREAIDDRNELREERENLLVRIEKLEEELAAQS